MTEGARRDLSGLEQELGELYGRLTARPAPRVSVRFFPYSTLRHTIRRRRERVKIRISDVLEEAPDSVLAALSTLLVYKLFRRPPPASCRRRYRAYTALDEVIDRVRLVRRCRGRKKFRGPVGKHFNLRTLLENLNESFFNNEVEIDQVSWSHGKSRRRLGHFDPAFRAIVISRALDRRDVPDCVVEFVMYHEMLHAFLGETVRNGRRLKHHARFRAAERDFPAYEEAMRFIAEKL